MRHEPTVLYIEDDKHNTELMALILSQIEGMSMISAHIAELGIELARRQSPDMIIMDLNLPGMDGYEALKIIRGHEKNKDIPVIALSAAAMPHDLERGKQAGFQRYLTKPIDIDEVMTIVKELIEGQKS